MIIKKDIVTLDKVKKLKNGAIINRFSHIVKGSFIGADVMIGSFNYIAGVVGDRCRIQNYVSVWKGVIIDEDCFIGPNVAFTNSKYPMTSRQIDVTRIHKGCIVGANSTILPVEINKCAMIGAGSLIIGNVPKLVTIKGVWK